VLDRKPSEERKFSTAPSLDTIDDNEAMHKSGEDQTKNLLLQSDKPKAILTIGNVNLTESSSSGSVCESVCTAYEQNGKKKSEKNPLEGILKTSSLLLSKSVVKKENETAVAEHPHKPMQFNYEDLTIVDHRLKLYIFQNILEDNDEKFMWLVKCAVVEDAASVNCATPFDALIVMSTKKIYILKIVGAETEDISSWLKKLSTFSIEQISLIEEMPFSNGFTVKTKTGVSNHLFMRDSSLSRILHKHIITSSE
jgi:hypothetical protein